MAVYPDFLPCGTDPPAPAFEARRAAVERWPSEKITKEHVINEKARPRSGIELLVSLKCSLPDLGWVLI